MRKRALTVALLFAFEIRVVRSVLRSGVSYTRKLFSCREYFGGRPEMKALVTNGSGLALTELPDPEPAAGQVLVAVDSCGICGSDVHAVESGRAAPGRILGHEFSGRVAGVGPGVSGWQVGQPVAVNPLGSCGTCEWCRKGLFILCRSTPNLGLSAPGAYAELVVADQQQLHSIPDGVPLERGSRAEPLAVALRGIVEAAPAAGDNALVFGVGPIGLCVILGLRASGAGTIVAVGRSEGRRAAAQKVGADVVLDSRSVDVAEYCQQAGIELHQAYECSGHPAAIQTCLEALRTGGTLVELALGSDATFNPRLFVTKNLRMVAGCAFGDAEYTRSLDLICSGQVDVEPLISQRVSLAEGANAIIRLRTPGDLVSVLIQPAL
jgi:threonine dehydrogenase-like Zn-dependent dehydrogenase